MAMMEAIGPRKLVLLAVALALALSMMGCAARVQQVRSAVTEWTTPRRLIPKRASGEHPLSAALNDILGRTAGQRSNQQLGCADPPWPLGALGSNARLMLVRGVQL